MVWGAAEVDAVMLVDSEGVTVSVAVSEMVADTEGVGVREEPCEGVREGLTVEDRDVHCCDSASHTVPRPQHTSCPQHVSPAGQQ